jgi:hypothetical protein
MLQRFRIGLLLYHVNERIKLGRGIQQRTLTKYWAFAKALTREQLKQQKAHLRTHLDNRPALVLNVLLHPLLKLNVSWIACSFGHHANKLLCHRMHFPESPTQPR